MNTVNDCVVLMLQTGSHEGLASQCSGSLVPRLPAPVDLTVSHTLLLDDKCCSVCLDASENPVLHQL